MNVINTLRPGSISSAIIKLLKKKEEKEKDDAPIFITNEYQQLFNEFK